MGSNHTEEEEGYSQSLEGCTRSLEPASLFIPPLLLQEKRLRPGSQTVSGRRKAHQCILHEYYAGYMEQPSTMDVKPTGQAYTLHTSLQDVNSSWRLMDHSELQEHNHQRIVF